MKTTSISPGIPPVVVAAAVLLCTLFSAPSSQAVGKPGGTNNKKEIPSRISFHGVHTDFDGNQSVPNGLTDDGTSYERSNTIDANVGRNANARLVFASGRSLNIDLRSPLGEVISARVDLVEDFFDGNNVTILTRSPDGLCDYFYYDPDNLNPLSPPRPQPPADANGAPIVFGATDLRFLIAMGVDLDDLLVDGNNPCEVETNARLDFTDSAGNKWRLAWGPRQVPGGNIPDPRSDPIKLLRTNSALVNGVSTPGNYWFFQTSGDHRAALFREESAQGGYDEYYGQFTVPYSGCIEALTYDPNLTGNHCDLRIPNIGKGLVPSTVTLEHDQSGGNNQLVATAVDQCDDFSAALASFDWYVDGVLMADNTGNTFDLSPYTDATVTVSALHPDWIAKLPNLQTISHSDVAGSAQFVLGSGGGASMSVAPLVWSYPRGGKDVKVVITIEDAPNSPLAGMDVIATLDGPAGSGISETFFATTNSNGEVSKKLKDVPDGHWCVTIIDVQDPGSAFAWDVVAPSPNCATK